MLSQQTHRRTEQIGPFGPHHSGMPLPPPLWWHTNSSDDDPYYLHIEHDPRNAVSVSPCPSQGQQQRYISSVCISQAALSPSPREDAGQRNLSCTPSTVGSAAPLSELSQLDWMPDCKQAQRSLKSWSAHERAKHSDACRNKQRLTLAEKLEIIALHSSGKSQVRSCSA